MSVHYKFKSALDYDTVSFDGLHISVGDLKKAIIHQKRIGKNTDFDLQITNAQTKEDYTDDNALIAKNTSLIVARVPLTVQQKRSWDRSGEAVPFGNSKEETNLGRAVDLTRLDASEEDKIRAMMTQSTQDYDPSNYMKIRGANQTGEVPTNYRCFRCHQPGHWIKNCPLSSNQEPIEIKKSTGIPRSFMVPVDSPSVPGAMMTPTGHYAVPVIDHQAYKEGKKERPPFSQDPDPVIEKPEIPDDLLCNICKDLMTDAVMIPCCGNSFCDECIRTFLLESEDHECPDCADKDNSPETLIPNRFLRNAVSNFKNETGYAKRPIFRPPKTQPEVVVESSKQEVQLSNQELTSQSAVSASSQEAVEKSPVTIEIAKPIKPALSTMIAESASAAASAAAAAAVTAAVPTSTASESEVASEPSTKLHTDDESEVPPPPGTEPLLPIPAAADSSEHDRKSEEEYPRERHHRERRRSYSRDSHRDRQSHHGDYQGSGSGSHMMNPSHSKPYSNHPSSDGHYQHHMHYDSGPRRTAEDRAGTPTVDEPHLHPPASNQPPLIPFPPGDERVPAAPYNQPPPIPHNPPLLPDPYMGHRVPMYPPHQQQGPQYPPPPRYERPPYQYGGNRPSQPPRGYSGPPRPRGMISTGYRGIQPPPPGLGRNMHNGGQGVIDDPLEAFERMLREKDERDRRLGKHRRRTRSRSRSRSYTRSRSRSFGRRSPPSRISRSRTPPSKRRGSRSPPPLRRSRTPVKRRSRSGSFSISRSRSFSRSQSPRGSLPRDRERDRDRDRDAPHRYRSPARSPPRFHRDRERERDRPKSRETREPFNTYYNDPPSQDYSFRERDRDLPPRDRPVSHRYPPRNQVQHNAPSMIPPIGAGGHQPILPMGHLAPDRKDYYDSYNRYPAGPPGQRYNSPHKEHSHKRFDDVAPPGTEGYYDLPPPGVDHLEKPERSRDAASKNQEPEERERPPPRDDRTRDREDRNRERDDRDRPAPLMKERERFRDERGHRIDDKGRGRDRDRDRRDRDYERDKDRHDRYEKGFVERKKKRSTSPYVSKSRNEAKEVSPERSRKKDKDHEDKPEEKKKEKKIKDKKKKKDTEEKEKKKKKKKEKKLIQKEALKEEPAKTVETEVKTEEEKAAEASALLKVENIKLEESQEATVPGESKAASVEGFEEKSLAINPEPPETTATSPKIEESEPGTNPPNPNFKPIPELKNEVKSEDKAAIDSLYSGLDDTEINTVITEKYAILPENEAEVEEKEQPVETKSPKKDEFLAPVPELSKWERDDNIEKQEIAPESEDKKETEDSKDTKIVTSEVLKRAENAIFQKAINAIRPIEIKKISESRKVLYQNPEPKILEVEPPREPRKSVNVTINVGKNERNVEISEPAKKSKLDRSKFKPVPESHSPTRLSAKERLGDKVEDEKEEKPSPKALLREAKIEPSPRSRSPRIIRDRRLSPLDDKRLEPIPINPERKVFLEEKKRERTERPKERNDSRNRQELREARMDPRQDLRADLRAAKIERERERDRTPPIMFRKIEIVKPSRKEEEVDKEKERKKEKKREEKKRKKEHRSRSKSKDRKKKKDKKHKKDKEKHLEKKQKHKEKVTSVEKSEANEQGTGNTETPAEEKKQRKNPRLVSDRKRSMLDESNFEPDYSASESESETEEKAVPVKKAKIEELQTEKEAESKLKKRPKSLSSDDESSSTETTSSDSESSDESHKKRKKKHKKHKKKKSVRKESSSDSDSYSDSSDSSSEEERHKKKSKKFKKSKQKKKKKSKHK